MEISIRQGIHFLEQRQLPSGAFAATRAAAPDMIDAQAFPCVFVTPFVLHVLKTISAHTEMVDRGRGFLRATMELGWAWRFYGPNTHLPLDWDDTACALVALADPHVSNLALHHRLDYRRSDGWYWTWMLDIAPHDRRVKVNDVDAVVNANVLFWLARSGVVEPELINNMRRWVTDGRFVEPTIYYDSVFAFAYCLSRAAKYGPVPELSDTLQRIVDKIITMEDEGRGWRGPLANAFVLVTLLNTGYQERKVLEHVRQCVLLSQCPDGGWPNAPFFPGQPGLFYGSRELTTAIALEGVSAYEQLS